MTVERACANAAETLRKIAKDYFKLAKLDAKYEEHYNLEGKRALQIANWYFNRSKTDDKFRAETDGTGTGNPNPLGAVPTAKR